MVMRCLVVAAFALCAVSALAGQMDEEHKVLHVLNRLTYGPAPGDVERVREMGAQAFIDGQLNPDETPEPEALVRILDSYGANALDTVALFREYGPKSEAPGGGVSLEDVREARDQAEVVTRQAGAAKFARAALSPHQLRELMVDFWFNHFNVDAQKGLVHLWAGSFEREAIRPFAMGRFVDLLAAVSMHPAMLIYLDNWRNRVIRGDEGLPDYSKVNETFARNLLDVHTLGPDEERSPMEVNALAKIFTGWRIGAGHGSGGATGFVFDAEDHDPMDKLFMGQTIKGGGVQEGILALKILAEHPATAKRISRQLARFFLADDPPEELVERMARAYRDSGGMIRHVLKTLFESPEFFDERYFQAKFKTPYRLAVSAARASGAELADPMPLLGALEILGMPLYDCPAPSGYKPLREAWLNPPALDKRLFFMTALAEGETPAFGAGAPVFPLSADDLEKTLGADVPEPVRQAARKAPQGLSGAVILASPAFQSY